MPEDKKIRNISEKRITSLNKISNEKVNLENLKHMIIDDNQMDFDKARSWIETAAAERVTMDPRRQSVDEEYQIEKLKVAFKDLNDLNSNTLFLTNDGKFLKNVGTSISEDLLDFDAELIENDYHIGFTLKGGQEHDGTAQYRQFQDIMKYVENSPLIDSKAKEYIVVYVSGSYWTKLRPRGYQGWQNKYNFPASLMDILRAESRNKKCIVLSDDDLPTETSSFYDIYIKDKNVAKNIAIHLSKINKMFHKEAFDSIPEKYKNEVEKYLTLL